MARQRIDRGTRMHIIVPAQYRKALNAYSRRTGINASEHVRRAIEAYLQDAAQRVASERGRTRAA